MARRLLIALLVLLGPAARAADVIAGAPTALSVTVYRAPWRNGGAIDLNNLGGFALVKETRLVHLPAGESRLRFEGVADGIQPASAIITGLPGGVIEKNRDAAVLSPDALMRAAIGADLALTRTNRKTGAISRIPATVRSADANGVVFQTGNGVEALRCSGLPETFAYSRVPAGLASTPTLSVLTRTRRGTTAVVTLSYLAENFDWAANYVARLSPDGTKLSLQGWVTLANGNSVSLPGAATQIVAGKLNRVGGDDVAIARAPRVIARCWPRGSTSDSLPPRSIELVHPYGFDAELIDEKELIVTARRRMDLQPRPDAMAAPAPPPPPPPPEQLGDLKLYRVPEPTTIAAHESKQVRLLEAADVPATRLAAFDLPAAGQMRNVAASRIIRMKNDRDQNLGQPLPAGAVALFMPSGDLTLLAGETTLKDTAVHEDVELKFSPIPDLQARQTRVSVSAVAGLGPARRRWAESVEISNAGAMDESVELRLFTSAAARVLEADQPMALKDGRPIFRLSVPAGGALVVHYTVETR